jgi:hypothetical protein
MPRNPSSHTCLPVFLDPTLLLQNRKNIPKITMASTNVDKIHPIPSEAEVFEILESSLDQEFLVDIFRSEQVARPLQFQSQKRTFKQTCPNPMEDRCDNGRKLV